MIQLQVLLNLEFFEFKCRIDLPKYMVNFFFSAKLIGIFFSLTYKLI